MKRLVVSFAAAVALLFSALVSTTGVASAAEQNISRYEALKLAAKEKYVKAKVYLAEKAQKASDRAKMGYARAKDEYAKTQTPEAKAARGAKITAVKLSAMEKFAKAKLVVAEKSRQVADAAKAEYEKLKARYEASRTN